MSKPSTEGPLSDRAVAEGKRKALTRVLDMWDAALRDGVPSEALASAAIFAALTELVDLYGVEPVAEFADGLPARIRAGEFTPGE